MKRRGVRKITDPAKIILLDYKDKCQFDLRGCVTKVRGYELLLKFGMFSKDKNFEWVVRDHRVSVYHGFKNNIDQALISHPANCRFIQSRANSKKGKGCEITVEQLIEDIKIF